MKQIVVKIITHKIPIALLLFIGIFGMNVQAQTDCSCPMPTWKYVNFHEWEGSANGKCNVKLEWNAPEEGENLKYNVYIVPTNAEFIKELVAYEITETIYETTQPSRWPAYWIVESVCEDGGISYPLLTGVIDCWEKATDIDGLSRSAVSLYPNPASTIVSISGSDIVKAEIYNALGQLIKIESGKSMHSVDVSSLAEGVYLMKLYDFYGNITNKPVVVAR